MCKGLGKRYKGWINATKFRKRTRKCAKGWINATKFWKRDQKMCEGMGKRYKISEKEPENVQRIGQVLQNFGKRISKCAKGWINATKF